MVEEGKNASAGSSPVHVIVVKVFVRNATKENRKYETRHDREEKGKNANLSRIARCQRGGKRQ